MGRISIDKKVDLLASELELREGTDDPVALVTQYVACDSHGRPMFTGREFERHGVGANRGDDAYRFTPDDLVALSLLGVPVSGAAALALLDEGRGWTDLLKAVDVDVTVADDTGRAQLLEPGSAANELWSAVKSLAGASMGYTRTGKLLARKRPGLLPIYDSVIEGCVRPGSSWWEIVARFFADDANAMRVEEIRDEAGASEYLSVLRTLDVILWMRHRGPVEG